MFIFVCLTLTKRTIESDQKTFNLDHKYITYQNKRTKMNKTKTAQNS